MMDSFAGWGHGFGLMWLVPLLVLVAIVALLRSLLGAGREDRPGLDAGPASAREILDRRFASGEISKEEYEEKRRALDP